MQYKIKKLSNLLDHHDISNRVHDAIKNVEALASFNEIKKFISVKQALPFPREEFLNRIRPLRFIS